MKLKTGIEYKTNRIYLHDKDYWVQIFDNAFWTVGEKKTFDTLPISPGNLWTSTRLERGLKKVTRKQGRG